MIMIEVMKTTVIERENSVIIMMWKTAVATFKP